METVVLCFLEMWPVCVLCNAFVADCFQRARVCSFWCNCLSDFSNQTRSLHFKFSIAAFSELLGAVVRNHIILMGHWPGTIL